MYRPFVVSKNLRITNEEYVTRKPIYQVAYSWFDKVNVKSEEKSSLRAPLPLVIESSMQCIFHIPPPPLDILPIVFICCFLFM